MKKEVMKKWVKALRSGSYRQTKSRLSVKESGRYKYCCLGVLCELASKEIDINIKKIGNIKQYDEEFCILPEKVKEWAGMKDSVGGGAVTHNGARVTLINLNDHYNYSFKKIADAIENDYKAL